MDYSWEMNVVIRSTSKIEFLKASPRAIPNIKYSDDNYTASFKID